MPRLQTQSTAHISQKSNSHLEAMRTKNVGTGQGRQTSSLHVLDMPSEQEMYGGFRTCATEMEEVNLICVCI